jgi:hypothetical protein
MPGDLSADSGRFGDPGIPRCIIDSFRRAVLVHRRIPFRIAWHRHFIVSMRFNIPEKPPAGNLLQRTSPILDSATWAVNNFFRIA